MAAAANTVLSTAFLLDLLGHSGGVLAMLILPPLLLISGGDYPQVHRPPARHPAGLRLGPALWAASWVFYPFSLAFAGVSRVALWLTGARKTTQVPFITREDLHLVVQKSGPEVDLEATERRIINRILRFSLHTVKEVMTPLVKITAIADTTTVAQALEEFRTTR